MNERQSQTMTNRVFTARSIGLSLVGLLLVVTFPAYSKSVLNLPDAIRGYLPVVPLFFVVVLSFGWNGTMGRLSRRLVIGTRELALVFGVMLVVCWIPSLQTGLVRHLVLPRYEELTTNSSWEEAGVTTRLPDALFPRAATGEVIGEKVHFGFIQGGVAAGDIPYREWVGPLLHWMPLLVVLSFCLLALTFLVHRQWSVHEQLRYPLVAVADALIQQDEDRPGGVLLKSRLFWAGFGWVFFFLMWRYLHEWFPGKLPNIPNEHSLPWESLFPIMKPSNAGFFLLAWMPISFAIIGIAYFVPTDVSLSMGLTAPLGTVLGIQYYLVTGNPVSSGDLDVFRAGGFIAFGLILLYTGRAYYFPVLVKAVVPHRRSHATDTGSVWAARLFLAGYALLIGIFRTMGVDLLISWIIVTFLLLIFLVVTRLVCETGVPAIAPAWSLPGLLTGLFGASAIGATPLIFVTLLSNTIVTANSSQLIMPYMATSLKLLDDNKLDLRRFAFAAKVAIVVGLVVGFFAVLTLSYAHGEGNLSNSERSHLAKGVRVVLNLQDFGQADASEAAHGLSKIPLMQADRGTVGLVLAGLVAVVVTYMLRFRFAKWPLHPLFFLVLGSWVGRTAWSCFLIGWVIKTLIVKIGGGRVYRDLKPLFIGLIVGEFFSMGLILLVGFLYHMCTGNTPVSLWML